MERKVQPHVCLVAIHSLQPQTPRELRTARHLKLILILLTNGCKGAKNMEKGWSRPEGREEEEEEEKSRLSFF